MLGVHVAAFLILLRLVIWADVHVLIRLLLIMTMLSAALFVAIRVAKIVLTLRDRDIAKPS